MKVYRRDEKKVVVVGWDSVIGFGEAQRLVKSGVTAFIETARETPFEKSWAEKLGVKLYSPEPFASDCVAELGVFWLLALSRFSLIQNKYSVTLLPKLGNEATYLTALVLGDQGAIGQALVAKLRAFGVEVRGWDKKTSFYDTRERLVKDLAEADVVYLCYPSKGNESFFDKELATNLKEGVVLIDLSGRGLVEVPLLRSLLRKKVVSAFVCDNELEPVLREFGTAFGLQHLGANTVSARQRQEAWTRKCLRLEGIELF